VGCYYAILNGETRDIITNNITKGPGRITLQDGQQFESTSCQEWAQG
jgi:hypothetical protein